MVLKPRYKKVNISINLIGKGSFRQLIKVGIKEKSISVNMIPLIGKISNIFIIHPSKSSN
jgi:hypothetical protein